MSGSPRKTPDHGLTPVDYLALRVKVMRMAEMVFEDACVDAANGVVDSDKYEVADELAVIASRLGWVAIGNAETDSEDETEQVATNTWCALL